ncbi:MAG: SDR family NAD(P)-dependent oxidoreductase, partial [Candidatus Ventricola sp.]
MRFENKVAVVTGGSRGIGRAICLELARQGASIVLCYAGNEQAAEETAGACRAEGARVMSVRCDVANAQQVKDMMKAAVREYGRIDVLVNNAGVTRDGFLLMMRESDYDAVLDTNLKGTFLCIKNVVHTMMKQNYGRIVNVSSVTGLRGNPGQANYAASKAGVIGLTKAAAKELAMKNITVNAVAPGFIETDMTAAMTDAARAAALA